MSDFGPITTVNTVDNAVAATLRTWLAHYIAHVADQDNVDRPATPDNYTITTDLASYPEKGLPAVVIVSPGLTDTPGNLSGAARGNWTIGVCVVAQGRNETEVRTHVGVYAAAVRGALLQHPSLGGVALGVTLIDEALDQVGFDERRTMQACKLVFDVETHLANLQGPIDPPAAVGDPPVADPTATIHEETITTITPSEEFTP